MTNTEKFREALDRVEQSDSMLNYDAIFQGFHDKGIEADDIIPRVNVLTFNAWKAKGRVVKRGEHGVKVVTFIPVKDKKDPDKVIGKRPWTSTVFHITQTTELN